MKITLSCCEGKDQSGRCLKDRCPLYAKAQQKVQRAWPYVGTGFGNLYGNPTHTHLLSAVQEDICEQQAPDQSSER